MAEKGYGYLEDRRPSSNCDPYSVSSLNIFHFLGGEGGLEFLDFLHVISKNVNQSVPCDKAKMGANLNITPVVQSRNAFEVYCMHD